MVYTLAITSILLFVRRKRHISVTLLGFYSFFQIICVGNHFVSIYKDDIFQHFPQLFFVATPFYSLIIPLFYLFIKTSIHSDYSIRWSDLWHFALFILIFFFTFFSYLIKPDQYLRELLSGYTSRLKIESIVLGVIFNLQYLVYSVLLILELIWLHKKRQRLMNNVINSFLFRIVIYFYVFGFLLSISTSIISYWGNQNTFDRNFLNSIYFYVFFLFLFFITVKGYSVNEIFKYNKSDNGQEELDELYKTINKTINESKPFLEPLVSLSDFSDSMGVNKRFISQAINYGFGSNFNEFMNYYRIEYAKELLNHSPELNIQEVMFMSGFNSKATFNKVFKDLVKKTPTQFRLEQRS